MFIKESGSLCWRQEREARELLAIVEQFIPFAGCILV
jgi:hypothetical protein